MSTKNTDVVGFRRIFVLFVTLVLLPAMLLSGFGIIAILNERTAEKQRQRERAEALLVGAERALVDELQGLTAALASTPDDGLKAAVQALRARDRAVGPVFFVDEDRAVAWADPAPALPPAEVVDQVARAASRLDVERTGYMAVSERGAVGVVIVVRRDGNRLLAVQIDEVRLGEILESLPADDDLRVELRRDVELDTLRALEGWMRQIVDDAQDDRDLDEIAVHVLPAPFDRTSLAALGPPPSSTTTVVYLILLVVFYAILITGVVITSRLIWQETRISRLKTDFVSHVSHELRTPLTSIRMFIETLRLGRATSAEEQQECLDLLSRETERLSEMIERVLGYARLQSGRRVFRPEVVTVEDLVDGAVQAFRAHTLSDEDARSALSVELPRDLPAVEVDREALTEALVNLVGNAYKYTGPEKRIRITAAPHGKRVAISVEDNGPGIPKHEWRLIFDRFYQAGNLLSRERGGSGLGLAIARRIVEGHRGKISVRSAPGQGSTFTIELPTVRAAS